MPIERRTYLLAVGTALTTAGCTARSESTGEETPSENADTPTTATPDDSTTPVPSDPFDDVPCPSFSDTDRTVCSHTRDDAPVYLDASSEQFRPISGDDSGVQTITFTLHNDSDRPFRLNPHAWSIKRRTREGWTHVAPEQAIEPLVELPAGETYEWVLSRQPHPTPSAEQTLYPTVVVENGYHAFAVDGTLGDPTVEDRPTVECVALFDVQILYVDAGRTPTPLETESN